MRVPQAECDHMVPRNHIFGGLRGNLFQCPPCGAIFSLEEITTPKDASVLERIALAFADAVAKHVGNAPDCDAGDYLLPSAA